MVHSVFFFQAEDGIRDLVRSRGLGDVYKRQREHTAIFRYLRDVARWRPSQIAGRGNPGSVGIGPVSYTHLTLPTSDLV